MLQLSLYAIQLSIRAFETADRVTCILRADAVTALGEKVAEHICCLPGVNPRLNQFRPQFSEFGNGEFLNPRSRLYCWLRSECDVAVNCTLRVAHWIFHDLPAPGYTTAQTCSVDWTREPTLRNLAVLHPTCSLPAPRGHRLQRYTSRCLYCRRDASIY